MLVIGHRGASSAAVENSRAAFELAEQLGADAVELDVRVTLDQKLLLYHEPLPEDPDDRADLITLDEALDSMSSRILVNIEIKNSVFNGGFDPKMTVVEMTIETLKRRGGGNEQWLISSFSWASIQASRSLAPEIATAFLCRGLSIRGARRVSDAGHSAAHPHVSCIDAELVGNCHSLGLAVNTWACNDPERIVELADLGVDGVCTSVPDVALVALGRKPDRGGVNPRWAQWRERPT